MMIGPNQTRPIDCTSYGPTDERYQTIQHIRTGNVFTGTVFIGNVFIGDAAAGGLLAMRSRRTRHVTRHLAPGPSRRDRAECMSHAIRTPTRCPTALRAVYERVTGCHVAMNFTLPSRFIRGARVTTRRCRAPVIPAARALLRAFGPEVNVIPRSEFLTRSARRCMSRYSIRRPRPAPYWLTFVHPPSLGAGGSGCRRPPTGGRGA